MTRTKYVRSSHDRCFACYYFRERNLHLSVRPTNSHFHPNWYSIFHYLAWLTASFHYIQSSTRLQVYFDSASMARIEYRRRLTDYGWKMVVATTRRATLYFRWIEKYSQFAIWTPVPRNVVIEVKSNFKFLLPIPTFWGVSAGSKLKNSKIWKMSFSKKKFCIILFANSNAKHPGYLGRRVVAYLLDVRK